MARIIITEDYFLGELEKTLEELRAERTDDCQYMQLALQRVMEQEGKPKQFAGKVPRSYMDAQAIYARIKKKAEAGISSCDPKETIDALQDICNRRPKQQIPAYSKPAEQKYQEDMRLLHHPAFR